MSLKLGAHGIFRGETIPGINGYFDITVPMYSDSQFRRHFRMSGETVEVLTRMIGNTQRKQTSTRQAAHP